MTNLKPYLQKYAEPEAHLTLNLIGEYQHVMVIPAYRESIESLERVWSALNDLLVILVVNSPESEHPQNTQLLERIDQKWQRIFKQGQVLCYRNQQVDVLVINKSPLIKGVGEARKVGADIACQLIDSGVIKTPVIYNTDADATLPTDYLAGDVNLENSFTLYRFQHETADNLSAALYELSLLWYAAGLKSAGSIYGFPSVGSSFAVSAEAYATVRGFPKRAAGEDFYLLNKLRKVGGYAYTNGAPIKLSSRASDRVPFGTGPAIIKLNESSDLSSEPIFYHPNCFMELTAFLDCMSKVPTALEPIEQLFTSEMHRDYLTRNGFFREIEKRQNQKPATIQKFLLDWFDGFRTMKFIHFVRDQNQPNVSNDKIWNTTLLPMPRSTIDVAAQHLWQQLMV